MTDLSPKETTDDESEGMKNLRTAYDQTSSELAQIRKELALSKLGVTPNEVQMTALDAVLGGDWSDANKVGEQYGALFGPPSSQSPPTPEEPVDATGTVVEEAPAPPDGTMLDNVSAATAGATIPPGEEPMQDPVETGFLERRKDLLSGRRKEDASAQVLNRLIDRGAKDLPGGVYNHDEYQRKLEDGRVGIPPEVRLVD